MRRLLALALAGAGMLAAPAALAQVTGTTGGGQPVQNFQPTLALTETIATQGIFPSRDPGSAVDTLGMLHTFAGNFGPFGQPTTSGQILGIGSNTALFSIVGTTYGGNGKTTFALPDLRGAALIGADTQAGGGPGLSSYTLGQQSGSAANVLSVANLPDHDHTVPGGVTGFTGGGQPFDNRQPSLALTYQIAATGLFPGGGVDPFIGQIGAFAGNFESAGWLNADGRLLSIANYDPLFNLIGTTYGGDGQTTFALPDLRGRLAVGAGGALTIGETFGTESITLTDATMPAHVHTLPGGGVTGVTGLGQAFDNAQPSLAINYLIDLQGIFPLQDGGQADGEPYLGEIVGYAGDFVPQGWALAQGQLLSIVQNQALFAILGTTYGGDGKVTFALPDLRGRTIVGTGGNFVLGEEEGFRETALTLDQLPAHDHTLAPGIPEPASWAMLIVGLGGVGAVLRQRRRPTLA